MGIEKVKCSIISGSTENDYDYLINNVNKDSFIIAADSGYLKCQSAGLTPDLIIGDFDSSKKPEADCEIICLPVEKDDSDTFYCVKEAHRRGFSEIEIFNAIGDRIDHTYSNILCLQYCLENNIKANIRNRKNKIKFVSDEITINDSEYKYFSVFSYSDFSIISIENAYYPLDNYRLNRFEQIGQSNHFKNSDVKIKIKNGTIILIQSND